jgi:hypothetical protein
MAELVRCELCRLAASYGRLALAQLFVPHGAHDHLAALVDLLPAIAALVRQPPRIVVPARLLDHLVPGSHCPLARAADGRLYGAPQGSNWVVDYDPRTGSCEAITLPMVYWDRSDTAKHVGALAAGPDGRLYAAPYEGDGVLVVDPVARTADVVPIRHETLCAYTAPMTLASDGCLYCPPESGWCALRVDPATRTVGFVDLPVDVECMDTGDLLVAEGMYTSELVEHRGVLFGAPGNGPFVLALDLERQICVPLEPADGWDAPQGDHSKWAGPLCPVRSGDGAVTMVCLPHSDSLRGVLAVDCDRAVAQIRAGASACTGCVREEMRCDRADRPWLPSLSVVAEAGPVGGSLIPYAAGTRCIGTTSVLGRPGVVFFGGRWRRPRHLELPLDEVWSAPMVLRGNYAYVTGVYRERAGLARVHLHERTAVFCPSAECRRGLHATLDGATGDIWLLDLPTCFAHCMSSCGL